MKFIITTTKDYKENCWEGIVSENIPYHKAKRDKILWNKPRYDTDGYWVDHEEIGEDWTIEIDSIEDLLRILDECGCTGSLHDSEIVIFKYEKNDDYYGIEIVNDYRS